MKHKIILILIICILASSFVSAAIITHTWDTEPQFVAGSSTDFSVQLNLDNTGVCDAKFYFFDIEYYYPGKFNVNPPGICTQCPDSGTSGISSMLNVFSGQDPFSECNTGSTAALGCATGNCNGLGACGAYSSDDQSCPQCYTCSDGDVACEYYSHNQDDGCGTCRTCSGSGSCHYESNVEDVKNECNTGSTTVLGCATGNCNGAGACGAYSSADRNCPQCYRCSDSDVACETYNHNQDDGCGTCKTCNGAGACHNENSGEDVKNECNTGSTSALGCATGTCNGAGACGAYSSGDRNCPQCYRCSDGDVACETYNHNQDDGCGICKTCNGAGACHNENNGEDVKSECSAYSCSNEIKGWSGNSCQRYTSATTTNGDCNGAGACNGLSTSCQGASTTASCGSSGCKKACPAGGAVSSYNSVSEVCYTSGQRGCSSGYECDSTGTCAAAGGTWVYLGIACDDGGHPLCGNVVGQPCSPLGSSCAHPFDGYPDFRCGSYVTHYHALHCE